MKTDINGCSTCLKGQENYEYFHSDITNKDYIQYDYREKSGKLFSCVSTSLEIARQKRDSWLKKIK